jgi:putative pyrimidine permease RutG
VHDVDLASNRNLLIGATIFILGTGDFTLTVFGFSLGGIGTATFCGIVLNALVQWLAGSSPASTRDDNLPVFDAGSTIQKH